MLHDDRIKHLAILQGFSHHRSIGHTNPIVARVADALDLTVVGWTVGGHDGLASASAGAVAARVRRRLSDGVIVALHDAPETGDREPAAARALPAILDAIASQGLRVVPLDPWTDADRAG